MKLAKSSQVAIRAEHVMCILLIGTKVRILFIGGIEKTLTFKDGDGAALGFRELTESWAESDGKS